MANAQPTALPDVPFKKQVIDPASLEIPVVFDWVRLPAGEFAGVEAQFISVNDAAELSVFSVPYQSDFVPGQVKQRAEELKVMLAPTATFEDTKVKAERIDGVASMTMTARWNRPEGEADVFAMAVPVKGRTSVVFLMMARRDGGKFDAVVRMFVEKTLVLETPTQVADPTIGTYDDGRGFSIEIPDGFRRILVEELEAVAVAAGVEPEEREPDETLGFVRPGIHRQSPNIIVSMAPAWMAVSEEMRIEFESRYRILVSGRDSTFTLDRTTIVEVAGRDSYRVDGSVQIVGDSLSQVQYFVPVDEHSLILTFTTPSALEDDETYGRVVEGIVESVTIDDPSEPAEVESPSAQTTPDEQAGSTHTAIVVIAILLAAVVLIVLLVGRGRK